MIFEQGNPQQLSGGGRLLLSLGLFCSEAIFTLVEGQVTHNKMSEVVNSGKQVRRKIQMMVKVIMLMKSLGSFACIQTGGEILLN